MSKRKNTSDIPSGPIYFGPEEYSSNNITDLLTEMGKKKTSATLFRDDIIKEIVEYINKKYTRVNAGNLTIPYRFFFAILPVKDSKTIKTDCYPPLLHR